MQGNGQSRGWWCPGDAALLLQEKNDCKFGSQKQTQFYDIHNNKIWIIQCI